jgi:radical SAM superfamily enzyme YgiQ (UPF0313 family)
MPNGALPLLAGNVDDHHRVAVADLILSHRRVRATIDRLFRQFVPEVVGLSVMTFQRRTAHHIIDLARAIRPDVRIVVGGYDPSLAPEAYEPMGIDYIVRGEGEVTFRELLRALERDEASKVSVAFPIAKATIGSITLHGERIDWKEMTSACRIVPLVYFKGTPCSGARWM